jgi:hypothetical protein
MMMADWGEEHSWDGNDKARAWLVNNFKSKHARPKQRTRHRTNQAKEEQQRQRQKKMTDKSGFLLKQSGKVSSSSLTTVC